MGKAMTAELAKWKISLPAGVLKRLAASISAELTRSRTRIFQFGTVGPNEGEMEGHSIRTFHRERLHGPVPAETEQALSRYSQQRPSITTPLPPEITNTAYARPFNPSDNATAGPSRLPDITEEGNHPDDLNDDEDIDDNEDAFTATDHITNIRSETDLASALGGAMY